MEVPQVLEGTRFLLAILASLALFLYLYPVEKCAKCAHCKDLEAEKLSAKVRSAEDREKAAHVTWHRGPAGKVPEVCPFCRLDEGPGASPGSSHTNKE